jgi:hypothetical protein
MKKILLALSLFSLTGCGGPMFFAEVEVPEVCKSLLAQDFPAAPVPGFQGTLSFPPFTLDFGDSVPLTNDEKLEATIRILSGHLSATSGVSNLDFVDAASIRLLPPASSTLPPLSVVDYTRPAGAPSSNSIEITDASDPDIFPYVQAGAITLEISLTGTLPTTAWSADISACAGAKAKYRYLF